MTDLVGRLFEEGVLSPLDRQFARAMTRHVGGEPEVVLAAALATRAVRNGHVCADLRRLHATTLLGRDEEPLRDVRLPEPERWCTVLGDSALVGTGEVPTPLVLDAEGRLYLYRYFDYERRLAADLRARARATEGVDEGVLRDGLARLFPARAAGGNEPDVLQRRAAVIACAHALTVVSGGPGTGKTTVVVRILALLQEQAVAAGRGPLRVALLAPTGKAAQRLSESVARNRERLPCDPAVIDAIPTEASTIHRALGWRPRTPTRFRHDVDDPLPADVVLVDEASMIDVALMTKLVEAVPRNARLILIGDKDQLASVEAGAILGDIYNAEADHGYSPALDARLAELIGAAPQPAKTQPQIELPLRATPAGTTPIQDCMVHLTHSWRYAPGSGIALLAEAVNARDHETALKYLRSTGKGARYTDVRLVEPTAARTLAQDLAQVIDVGYRAYLEAPDPADRLALLGAFRILCAHRRGERGVEDVNRLVEQALVQRNLVDTEAQWYDGRPILVTHNDYQLRVFNGDVGVIARDRSTGQPWAYFPDEVGDALRRFAPARLPPHETVFAMTVHKSQGSEFDRIALVLPEEPSPITTRELLYTAVTRARRHVDVFGSEKVLAHAIQHAIERASGLRAALWG